MLPPIVPEFPEWGGVHAVTNRYVIININKCFARNFITLLLGLVVKTIVHANISIKKNNVMKKR